METPTKGCFSMEIPISKTSSIMGLTKDMPIWKACLAQVSKNYLGLLETGFAIDDG